MHSQTINVTVLQQRCGSNKLDNLQATSVQIAAAKASGAELVVLPELHATPYFCQVEDHALFNLAESIPGETTDHLSRLAKQHQLVLVGSIFEKRAPGVYHNTAVVFDADGSLAGIYRKMHIPDDPGYYEKFYFAPGDLGFTPIKTSIGNIGVLVCWDQWYPEAARIMALNGADFLVYPTAIGWDPEDDEATQLAQREAWITIQRSHAIANLLPVIVCNRVGFETDPSQVTSGQQFWGSSFVCDQQGGLLATAGSEGTDVLSTMIDLTKTEQLRKIWPYFRDRRIDAYDVLMKRYNK